MKSKILGLLAVGLLAGPIAANAAPLNYDESVSGDITFDIANVSSSLTVFEFGVGTNTISGRHGVASDTSGDLDPFRFVIPDGTSLTSLSITWGNTVLTGDFSSGGMSNCDLRDSDDISIQLVSVGTPQDRCVDVVLNPFGTRDLFSDFLPLSSGSYVWAYGRGVESIPGEFTSWASDYRLDFTVASTGFSVPEPGTLALLGLGLVGMGYARRRKAA